MPPKPKKLKTSVEAEPSNTVESDVDSPYSSGSEEVEDMSDINTTGSDSDDSNSVDSQMEVHIDFEARTINDDDFHGINRLLRQVFLKSNIDISGLSNLVIEQANHVGSTIKVCDDGDLQPSDSSTECKGEVSSDTDSDADQVFGVTSMISLAYHHDKPCVNQLKEMLLTLCKTHASSVFSLFSTLLSKRIGLLINERFLNISSEIAPPLLNGLIVEIKEASGKLHDQFSCRYYLLVTRSHVASLPKRKRKEGGKKGKADTGAMAAAENTPVFDYLENELLHKDSVVSFSYPVSEESDQVLGGKWSFDDNVMKPYRTVMIFESQTFEHAVTKLEMK